MMTTLMKSKAVKLGGLMLAASLLAACASGGGIRAVSADDTSDRGTTKLTMADYRDLAEEVTNQMLTSPAIGEWASRDRKPRILVSDVLNDTDDENVDIEDIHFRIQQVILQSGIATFVEQESTLQFDYVVLPRLSTKTERGSGRLIRRHFFTMNLQTVKGETVDIFSVDRAFERE